MEMEKTGNMEGRYGTPLLAQSDASGDFWPVEGYISENVQGIRPQVQLVTNKNTGKIQWYHFEPFSVTTDKGSEPPIVEHRLYLWS